MPWRTDDPAVRYGVWMAHKQRCMWCPEPVTYRSLTVDHVIPATTDAADLPRIREQYALPADFALEDFTNWVPAHNTCNASKNATMYAGGGAMVKLMHDVVARAQAARQLAEGFRNAIDGAKLMLRLEEALANEQVSVEDAQEMIHRSQTDEFGWRVIGIRDGVETITNGRVVAKRPAAENDDLSWICGRCGQPGPWQGNICTVCGTRSTPDD